METAEEAGSSGLVSALRFAPLVRKPEDDFHPWKVALTRTADRRLLVQASLAQMADPERRGKHHKQRTRLFL